MITKDELQELFASTETYRIERNPIIAEAMKVLGYVDCYHFKHGCNAFEGLRFQFKPEANSLLANSVKTGDIYGEFTIGLVEYTDSKGIKSRSFRYEGSQAE